MKAKRHTPNQVIRKLREAELMLGEGKSIAEVAKVLEVSEVTFHRWRNQYGGMKAEDAKRLKELERENGALKRLVADKELEILAHKEISRETSEPGPEAEGGPHALRPAEALRASGVRDHRPASIDPAPRAKARQRRSGAA